MTELVAAIITIVAALISAGVTIWQSLSFAADRRSGGAGIYVNSSRFKWGSVALGLAILAATLAAVSSPAMARALRAEAEAVGYDNDALGTAVRTANEAEWIRSNWLISVADILEAGGIVLWVLAAALVVVSASVIWKAVIISKRASG